MSSSLTETIASCGEFMVCNVLFLYVPGICVLRLLTFQIYIPLLLDFSCCRLFRRSSPFTSDLTLLLKSPASYINKDAIHRILTFIHSLVPTPRFNPFLAHQALILSSPDPPKLSSNASSISQVLYSTV